jgi:hypothetical protein
MRAERVLARPCRQCGAPFEPTRAHQRFCRPACRLAHFRVSAQRSLPFDEGDDLFAIPFE